MSHDTASGECRVAVVAACPLPAQRGTPIRIQRLSESMLAQGLSVNVFSYHLGDLSRQLQVPVHRIPPTWWYQYTDPGPTLLKPLVDLRLARLLRKHLVTGRSQVIYAHHVEGLLCALYANRPVGLPVIFDVHTLLGSELPSYRLGLPAAVLASFGRALDRWLPRQASHIVAVSERIEQQLIDGDPAVAERISTIPNGSDDEVTANMAVERQPTDQPVVLFTGNLAGYQDVPLLLQAFALVAANDARTLLRIVTNDDIAPIRAQAVQLGIEMRVQFAPADLEQLPRHFAEAAVAVNPRRIGDGLPQKLVNYMAAGCPIVSWAGTARHLQHLDNGWIAQGDSAESLADGIETLLRQPDLAQRLGLAAARYAGEHLTWASAAHRVSTICRELVATHSPNG